MKKQLVYAKPTRRVQKFVLSRGCPIRHLIHMEEKKSSQAMVAAKKELAVEDKATHAAAPKGDTFQLTYALQNDNINCQDEVISEFVDVFPKVLLFVKFLLILQLFLIVHKHAKHWKILRKERYFKEPVNGFV